MRHLLPIQAAIAQRCAVALILVGMLTGCALWQANPLEEAETLEQKSFAVYGLFVIAEEEAANLINDPAVPDTVKFQIQYADRIAKPAADILLTAARGVASAREELAATRNETASDKLRVAVEALNAAYTTARPKILTLQSVIKNL